MLINKNQKLALIHTAKRDRGLDDECYRLLLQSCAGVDSAADIMTEKQFDGVMAAFKKLGFVHEKPGKPSRPRWADSWACTEDQRAKIEACWKATARNPTERALRAFIKRIAGVESPRWLTADLAQKIIVALEKMAGKAAPG